MLIAGDVVLPGVVPTGVEADFCEHFFSAA